MNHGWLVVLVDEGERGCGVVYRTLDSWGRMSIVSPKLKVKILQKRQQLYETNTQFVGLNGSRLRTAPGAVILLRLQDTNLTTTARPLVALGADRLNPLVGLVPLNLLLSHILLVFLRRPHQNSHKFFGKDRVSKGGGIPYYPPDIRRRRTLGHGRYFPWAHFTPPTYPTY